jgi:putative endonuclease
LLRCKGYQVLKQRYRTPVGEIDIIARKGNVLAIVEVKARPDLHQAHEAISPHQQARLARAAHYYVARHPQTLHTVLRFDVIFVLPGQWPRHIINAFCHDDSGVR